MVNGSDHRPALFRDRPLRPQTTWQHVAVLAILAVTLIAVVWACAWGVRG
jgi:hypothetical protein